MAQNKYLKQNGEVIYPYTTTHNVLNDAGLGAFDGFNGIIGCYATSPASTTGTLQKNFSSSNIKISSISGNTGDGGNNYITVQFTSPLPDAYYTIFTSGEASGVASEIMGVYHKTTTNFRIDNRNYNGTAANLYELSILIIY